MAFGCGARSVFKLKGTRLLEKRATAPSAARPYTLGIALGGSDLLIVFRNSDEEAQRLIHCIGVWEDICDVRLELDNIAKSLAARTELPHTQTPQIILRP
jgi:hypothetical protein